MFVVGRSGRVGEIVVSGRYGARLFLEVESEERIIGIVWVGRGGI